MDALGLGRIEPWTHQALGHIGAWTYWAMDTSGRGHSRLAPQQCPFWGGGGTFHVGLLQHVWYGQIWCMGARRGACGGGGQIQLTQKVPGDDLAYTKKALGRYSMGTP